ncbi:MAG: dihydrolipoyl dehydrogenase [Methylococcales bacterium]|nr:dihydrolipoyl dehydrogenase [Methylococcales bacterium]MBT4599083.1 dihydrolipoyl dehydrogenase [Methylococcales bacterium]MBT5436689.1 dihydrolipoyl dehydrogenase [Methylococcales bacterium]MBT7107753.1 dihydrolipoyl dehydrogenase [Methylococcales bacterium]MBT7968919.1 dihydrolipoyl dehydrogenase [Methylococcales bacterium]
MSVKENQLTTEVLVIGGGPGGYSAAFRAADLGKQVTLVEKYPVLGGVCLNVGCIPSKALLHVAQVLSESKEIGVSGVTFQAPEIDREKLVQWKGGVTSQLTTGLSALAKQRKVTVLQGTARFLGTHEVMIENEEGGHTVKFDNVIIAVGSQPVKIPSFPNDDERLMDSTGALELKDIPAKLLIVGGGIIGLEMATVYHALGSQITIVEMMDQLIPGCDKDLVRPLAQKVKKQYDNIYLSTKVTEIVSQEDGLTVTFDKQGAVESDLFDKVLVAVGRRPNGHLIDAEKAGITVTDRGFIEVDKQMRTNVEHIFAIGDVVGNPMLAHKAVHEAKIAAEVIAGERVEWQALTIPSVAYTNPEVAWMGLTEIEAKVQGIAYNKAAFPWAASGRSLSIGRKEGLTKLITDKDTGQILGAGIVGTNAGELIGEAVLALEMGACAEDIALTVHPHPTLSETLGFSAEMIEGTITDLLVKKR